MAKSSPSQTSFNAGELSPQLEGRVDLDKYQYGCAKVENFLPMVQGGLIKRSGFRHVKEVEDSTKATRLISFEFNTEQAYIIGFGDQQLRFFKDSGAILETALVLTHASDADPVVCTTSGSHGLHTGDEVYISGLTNQTKLNGRFFKITKLAATTFSLQDFSGNNIDGGDQDADSGVTAAASKVYEVPWVDTISTITAISSAADGSITCSADHDLLVGDTVWFEEIVGTSTALGLNRTAHAVKQVTDSKVFTIEQSTAGYTSGGKVGKRVPWTSAQVEAFGHAQSADVLYIASPDHPPHKITRSGHAAWTVTRIDWEWEPFSPENVDEDDAIGASARTGTGITLKSVRGNFTAAMVGRHVKMREVIPEHHGEWKADIRWFDRWDPFAEDGSFTTDDGNECYYEGNVYEVVADSGAVLTGFEPPIHTEGTRVDGYIELEYINSGSGYAKITGFTDAYNVTADVIKILPTSCVYIGGEDSLMEISSATATNPVVVTVAPAHNFYETGDKVFLEGFVDMTELNNRTFTVTFVGNKTFSLDGEDGRTYTAETTGGGSSMRWFKAPKRTWAGYLFSRVFWHWSLGAFSGDSGYPRAVTFFEDRLVWAGTTEEPQTVWMSRTGDYENHQESAVATSSLQFTINTDQVNVIEWLSPSNVLKIGTAGAEFTMSGAGDAGLSPGNVKVSRNSTYGSKAQVQPVPTEQVLLFVQRAGRKIRELVFDFNTDSYTAPDLNILAEHVCLDRIKKMAFQQEPQRRIWCVLEDGELVCLTYERAHEVISWSRHPLGGNFGGGDVVVESVAVIPHEDGDRDQVWIVVKRTINTVQRRYVEFLEEDWLRSNDLDDAYFADSVLTYDGGGVTTITGLNHLEGETVTVLGDGIVQDSKTVSGGAITITSASTVQVGLGYDATYQSMRFEGGSRDGSSQGKATRISRCVFRFDQTGEGVLYGPTDTTADMQEHRITAGTLLNGDIESVSWHGGIQQKDAGARVTMKHNKPTPCTLIGVFPLQETYDR